MKTTFKNWIQWSHWLSLSICRKLISVIILSPRLLTIAINSTRRTYLLLSSLVFPNWKYWTGLIVRVTSRLMMRKILMMMMMRKGMRMEKILMRMMYPNRIKSPRKRENESESYYDQYMILFDLFILSNLLLKTYYYDSSFGINNLFLALT